MTMQHWRWEKDAQNLVWLTFDRQGESANTFSRAVLEELNAALDEVQSAAPKGLIIRSAKDSFIAGADVNEFVNFKSPEEAASFVKRGWDVFQKLRDLPFPTTAMVNGFCMGGGLELALACRYRVALDEPKVRFSFPEVMLGIWPVWHGLQWLPKRIGPVAAFDMLLTGKAIDAKRARRTGPGRAGVSGAGGPSSSADAPARGLTPATATAYGSHRSSHQSGATCARSMRSKPARCSQPTYSSSAGKSIQASDSARASGWRRRSGPASSATPPGRRTR